MRRLVVLCLALVGCRSSSTEPPSRVPRVGVYDYRSSLLGSGSLTITHADVTDIAALWAISSADPVVRDESGRWDGTAYVLEARVITSSPAGVGIRTFVHRIARDGERMACTVREAGASVPQPCTLTFRP